MLQRDLEDMMVVPVFSLTSLCTVTASHPAAFTLHFLSSWGGEAKYPFLKPRIMKCLQPGLNHRHHCERLVN